jgi:hypothetical protein
VACPQHRASTPPVGRVDCEPKPVRSADGAARGGAWKDAAEELGNRRWDLEGCEPKPVRFRADGR